MANSASASAWGSTPSGKYAELSAQAAWRERGRDVVTTAARGDANRRGDNRRAAPPRRRAETATERFRGPEARELAGVADALVKRSVWIVGGDGWAYDIGFGGLDHILSIDRDINVLVLDTGVYSNTGGQSSKATPRAAVAKFAANGKAPRKKDLGMLAVSYGNVYVAQIALGANPNQTLRAFHEAESYPGPSLILAYSQCIAHGINMSEGMTHQKTIVQSGLWPLYRFDPRLAPAGEHPFHLDSRKPTIPFTELSARGPLRDGCPQRPRARPRPHRVGPAGHRRPVALLRTDGDVEAGVLDHRSRSSTYERRLATSYLGLLLPNPIVASAGPLTGDLDSLMRLEQAGVAAAVLPSLFEEQITGDELRIHALYEVRPMFRPRALSFIPGARLSGWAWRVLEAAEEGQASASRTRHCEPQRQFARRLGALRQILSRRRRQRHRAQHLLRTD